MVTVGIRNLKDSLSRYLRMVQKGERIIITDHDRIIAEIVPVSAIDDSSRLLEEYLKEKTESGGLIGATKRTSLVPRRTGKGRIDQKQIDKVYKQARDDRA